MGSLAFVLAVVAVAASSAVAVLGSSSGNLSEVHPTSGLGIIGINLGNVLEAPHEGEWAPAAQEYYFDDYVKRGFRLIRIPVRWDMHMQQGAPYTIDGGWMQRVHQVVDWAMRRGLNVIINSHHDEWIDDEGQFYNKLPRFTAMWRQIALSFANYSQPQLSFEVYNEIHKMNKDQMNTMYAQTVPIMRQFSSQNWVRPIYLGGLSYMRPWWILNNWDTIVPPPLAGGGVDPNLHLEVHSYDPWAFCGEHTTAHLTDADQNSVRDLYARTQQWLNAHKGRFQTVLMGEAGCIRFAQSRADLLTWYGLVAALARINLDARLVLWDDNGDFPIYHRAARTWDEEIMGSLHLPPPAPADVRTA